MGESFLLACSDLWLAHALKHKHLYPHLYFYLSKVAVNALITICASV